MSDSRILMTVEEYLALDRASEDARYEYIDGIVTMRVRGTINSSRICVNITSELSIALRGKSCQIFGSDLKVSISATHYVYPDVSVTCDQHDLQEKGDIIYSPRSYRGAFAEYRVQRSAAKVHLLPGLSQRARIRLR